MKSKLFSGVKFEEVAIGGSSIRFPIRYIDQSRISATFTASTEKVREKLPTRKLKPVEVKPGTTTLTVMAMQYRRIDGLAPYNEMGTFAPVVYEAGDEVPGKQGIYCFHMPVTTERARYGGVAGYGFPKFIADIVFSDLGDALSCMLWADGKDILTLSVKKIETKEVTRDSYIFTRKGKQLVYTLSQQTSLIGASREAGGASLKLGDHRVAKDIRDMEIGQTPLEYSYMPKMQSLLHKPGERLPL
jgi:hypothetical protein